MVPFLSVAQNIGEWTVYSSYSTVNSISVSDEGNVYSSTLGGLFVLEDENNINTYTTIDGLHRLDIIQSVFDEVNNQLVIGFIDGVINVVDANTRSIRIIEDINRAEQFTSKQINDIEIYENKIFVATDFGIIVFDASDLLVSDSYLTIGNFNRGSAVLDITLVQDSIFVGTELGFGKASLSENLLDANVWITTPFFEEGIPTAINKVRKLDEFTLVLKGDSLLELNNNRLSEITGIDPDGVVDIDYFETRIAIAYRSKVVFLDSDFSSETILEDNQLSIRSIELKNDKLYIGTLRQGLIITDFSNENVDSYLPTGPFLNFFNNLQVKNEVLLSTSTAEFPSADPFNPIRGYYLFENGKWDNVNQATNEVMDSFNYGLAYTAYLGDEELYIGSWGEGILRQNLESGEVSIFNAANSGLTGIEDNRNYVVIGGISEDSDKNLWATSFQSDFPFNLYSNDQDEWFHFPNIGISSADLYYRLFIDSNDQKWISLIDFGNNGKGLLVVDSGSNLEDDSDDTFRKLTSDANNGNLPDDNVTAITEDKNGEIWIGTKRGIARFIFPDFIVESSNSSEINAQWLINEDTSATSRFLLRDVNVTSMAVNQANQKWVGSENQGVWLLNAEGSSIERHFTAQNSPLISNNILSIAINDVSGEVFFATDLGLVSYVDTPVNSVNNMEELKVFPNPFVYGINEQIVVENLADITRIRVLGVDGTVVYEFDAEGGRVTWNGLDYFGNRLGTGVYFLVAISEDGNDKGIGKIVIIN